jgi:hypothetical protein
MSYYCLRGRRGHDRMVVEFIAKNGPIQSVHIKSYNDPLLGHGRPFVCKSYNDPLLGQVGDRYNCLQMKGLYSITWTALTELCINYYLLLFEPYSPDSFVDLIYLQKYQHCPLLTLSSLLLLFNETKG